MRGDIPVNSATVLLIANSTNVRHYTQFFPSYARARITCSIVQFYRSVWPSVWGFYELLNSIRIPNIPQSAFQKAAVKCTLWSCMRYRRTPKDQTQWSKNNYATCGAVSWHSPALQGTSRLSLPNLSTITINSLYPFTSGKSVMKSIVQYSNLPSGIGNGCNKTAGC